eukprot:evm.model.scf_345.8 EVM.evm.TU.scf_345.8   scf_345:80086-81467(-)
MARRREGRARLDLANEISDGVGQMASAAIGRERERDDNLLDLSERPNSHSRGRMGGSLSSRNFAASGEGRGPQCHHNRRPGLVAPSLAAAAEALGTRAEAVLTNFRHVSERNIREAIEFIQQVKTRFLEEPPRYKEFTELMQMYKSSRLSLDIVVAAVERLFTKHPDLLMRFKTFLPRETLVELESPQKQLVEEG